MPIIISPNNLIKGIIHYRGRIIFAPRLQISNVSSTKQILEEFNRSIEKRAENLYQASIKIKTNNNLTNIKLYSELKAEIKILKHIIRFTEKEMGIRLRIADSTIYKVIKMLTQLNKIQFRDTENIQKDMQ